MTYSGEYGFAIQKLVEAGDNRTGPQIADWLDGLDFIPAHNLLISLATEQGHITSNERFLLDLADSTPDRRKAERLRDIAAWLHAEYLRGHTAGRASVLFKGNVPDPRVTKADLRERAERAAAGFTRPAASPDIDLSDIAGML